MKRTDLNEALAERSYKRPRRLGQPTAYPQCGADNRREGGSFPRKLEVTSNAAAAVDFTFTEGGEAGDATLRIVRNPAV
jgi:hypothetical protein